MYNKEIVPYGDKCERYKKKVLCRESVLIGINNFPYKNCIVDETGICKIAGIILPNGRSRPFFKFEEVPFGKKCDSKENMLMRFCDNSRLSGSDEFNKLSCKEKPPKKCKLDGAVVEHGGTRIFYSKRTASGGHSCNFFAYYGDDGEGRKCFNGVLNGQEEYRYATCDDN